jgi:hypothetical protein
MPANTTLELCVVALAQQRRDLRRKTLGLCAAVSEL